MNLLAQAKELFKVMQEFISVCCDIFIVNKNNLIG